MDYLSSHHESTVSGIQDPVPINESHTLKVMTRWENSTNHQFGFLYPPISQVSLGGLAATVKTVKVCRVKPPLVPYLINYPYKNMDGQFDDIDAVPVVEDVTINLPPAVKIKKAKKSSKKSKTPVEAVLEEPTVEEWNAGDEDDFSFDALESMLLNDGSYTGGAKGGMGGADLGKKINLSTRVQNDITRSEKKGEKRLNDCGKDDRATSEQVLDPRTRLILFKLLNNGFLSAIDGCLSTGKEANVYYARGEQGQEYAVKIFKTSILVFKDRDRYVSGEYRFRNGYCKSNPRKMVKTWAEKEMRNLKRLVSANVPCPTPHLLKSHVLVMDFLGQDGWCAPRLKEATLDSEQLYRFVSLN